MKYTVVFTDQNGQSHFKQEELGFELVSFAPPAPPVGLTSYFAASRLVFFRLPCGWFGDWHPAPRRQFFCCLSGEFEIVVSDGERRVFGAGEVFLLEDTFGVGHQSRVVGSGDFVAAIVQLEK